VLRGKLGFLVRLGDFCCCSHNIQQLAISSWQLVWSPETSRFLIANAPLRLAFQPFTQPISFALQT
jgi:hypothetical protein